jgi:hypothetical protein
MAGKYHIGSAGSLRSWVQHGLETLGIIEYDDFLKNIAMQRFHANG